MSNMRGGIRAWAPRAWLRPHRPDPDIGIREVALRFFLMKKHVYFADAAALALWALGYRDGPGGSRISWGRWVWRAVV